ncbi:MAG: acyltransferase family protein [Promethearchaeota archaeon]
MKKKEKVSEVVLTEMNRERVLDESQNFFQVDFLKALMIFLVIFDHVVYWDVKNNIGAALWERISIPVFLVLLGFNAGKSFQRQGDLSLKELYSWKYFKKKILRYIVPYLILYAVSTLIGLIIYGFDITAMYRNQYYPSHGYMNLFIGILPFWGPGNWFLPLLFQSILILPLLYKFFTKKPIIALISCFIIEIAMQLCVFFFIGDLFPGGVISFPKLHVLNMFMDCVLFYLSGIGLGMWFSFEHRLEHSRNFFMWLLYPISLAFIVTYQFFGYRIMIGNVPLLRGDYHFLIFPYSAFLVLLALKFLPQRVDGPIKRAISLIGKSTYHILLTQIFGFGIMYSGLGRHYIIFDGFSWLDVLYLTFAWFLFIPLGILWYKTDQNKNIYRRILYYLDFFIILTIATFAIFVSRGDWVPIPIYIILGVALAALIPILHPRIRLRTRIIALWTAFLGYCFAIAILYVAILPPTEFLTQNISIGAFLVMAVVGTYLDYKFLK